MDNLSKLMLTTALDFVTQREIPGNQGFEDSKFQELIEMQGWRKGQAWCAYFAELVVRTAGFEKHANIFSSSAVETFKNCQANSDLFKIYKIPSIGDIAVWQRYESNKQTWMGHIGIIVGMGKGMIVCVEGNSNAEGGREGLEVAIVVRDPAAIPTTGLRLLGFIRVIP